MKKLFILLVENLFLRLSIYLVKNDIVFLNEFIIDSFKKIQLDSLDLKTNIIKYKKPAVGQCYEIFTWVKSKIFPKGFIQVKLIRKKDSKLLQTSIY